MTDPEQVVIPYEMSRFLLEKAGVPYFSIQSTIAWLLDQPKSEHAQEYLERMFLRREEMPEEWKALKLLPVTSPLTDFPGQFSYSELVDRMNETVDAAYALHLASKGKPE